MKKNKFQVGEHVRVISYYKLTGGWHLLLGVYEILKYLDGIYTVSWVNSESKVRQHFEESEIFLTEKAAQEECDKRNGNTVKTEPIVIKPKKTEATSISIGFNSVRDNHIKASIDSRGLSGENIPIAVAEVLIAQWRKFEKECGEELA